MASTTLTNTCVPAAGATIYFAEAGEVIDAGRALRLGVDGKLYRASNTSLAKAKVRGLSVGRVNAAGQYLPYVLPGVLLTGVTGLTKGSVYYLDHGTDEVQTLTITGTPTGGTFTVSYGGYSTTQAYNVATATLQTALEALASIGTGNVVVGGTPGSSYTLTFKFALGAENVAIVTVSHAFTGGTTPNISAAETTPGAGAGNLCPYADLVTGEAMCTLGFAPSTTSFFFDPDYSGTVV